MQKKLITSGDLQLACTIYHPELTNTIFFIHGNAASSNTWRKQTAGTSLKNYRLITIDLPSHGASSEMPEDADFSLPGIAGVIQPVILQLLNGFRYIICGSSLGTNIVAEMLMEHLLPDGLVLAGPCIAGEGFGLDKMVLPTADPTPVFSDNVPLESVKNYAAQTSVSKDPDDCLKFMEDYASVKGNFRTNLFTTIAAKKYNDEILLLQKNGCPVCVVFGRDEQVINTTYLDDAVLNFWNNRIYKIPGASHLVHIDAPNEFNDLLSEFANAIFTTGAA